MPAPSEMVRSMTVINSAKKGDPKSLNSSMADFLSAPTIKMKEKSENTIKIRAAGSGETPGDDYQDNQLYTPLKKTNSS